MSNTSATGGYLTASTTAEYDLALDRIFSQAIRGITGLPVGMVRPAWQPEPPALPDISVNWCGFRISDVGSDQETSFDHVPDGDGSDVQISNETIELHCAFYGPDAGGLAARFSAGLRVRQNREELDARGIKPKSFSRPVRAPELINARWFNRVDLTIQFARAVSREYLVLNLLRAQGDITDDAGRVTPFDTDNSRN